MKTRLFLLALAPLALFAQATPDASKTVLTIGDEKITAAQFDAMLEAMPTQFQAQAKANKRAFAEQVVQLKVLAAEAEKQKLDQQTKIKDQLAFNRMSVLASAMFQNLTESMKVDDAVIEKYYNDHKSEYETVKAHHILVHVKGAPGPPPGGGKPELEDDAALAKAKALRARLVGGEDFFAVARSDSDDSSAAQGGDLGEFGKGMMVPPFEQAAFAAKVGEISEPVRSPFGYHIIRVDSHVTKPLADVKTSIANKLRPDLARQQIDAIAKAANVKYDDAFFGPPAAAK